jgi:hypothetical protein
MRIWTPFYATPPASSWTAIRIQTSRSFHRFPVGQRFQPATDKGKATNYPENDAHFVALGVALPEKEDGDRTSEEKLGGDSALTFTSIVFSLPPFYIRAMWHTPHTWPNLGLLWPVAGHKFIRLDLRVTMDSKFYTIIFKYRIGLESWLIYIHFWTKIYLGLPFCEESFRSRFITTPS